MWAAAAAAAKIKSRRWWRRRQLQRQLRWRLQLQLQLGWWPKKWPLQTETVEAEAKNQQSTIKKQTNGGKEDGRSVAAATGE